MGFARVRIAQFKKEFPEDFDKLLVLMEITVHNLNSDEGIDRKNFLDRMDAIAELDQPVLITNFFLFYQVRQFLQQHTKYPIRMVLGASLLQKLFNREHYQDLKGGVLEGFGRLVKGQTKLYVYPQTEDGKLVDSKSFRPEGDLALLYDYLDARKKFVDIVGCETDQSNFQASEILNMIASNNPEWEKLVPEPVVKAIKSKKINRFGDYFRY